jgi:hypothetical protein
MPILLAGTIEFVHIKFLPYSRSALDKFYCALLEHGLDSSGSGQDPVVHSCKLVMKLSIPQMQETS